MHVIIAFLLAALCSSARAADDAAADPATWVEQSEVAYSINDDGSYTETHRVSMRVLKEAAVANSKRFAISYSTGVAKSEILQAYTRKPDGRHVDVPSSNFQVQTNSGSGGNKPIFSDQTTLTVVFPEIAVGDAVVVSYVIRQTEAIFPNQFSAGQSFSRAIGIDEFKVRFEWPGARDVLYAARDLTEVKRGQADGRSFIEWSYSNKTPVSDSRRDHSVYDWEKQPGYEFSTFKSYADIAAAYAQRALPKSQPDDRVRALAKQITQGKTAPRAQAQALYEWVATNLTYAGNCIGIGAVVPHDMAFILDNKMGDCKDHAALLQALLTAQNIASVQALVNAGAVYRLPKVPVVAAVNHVINYLPDFNLFVDSTASQIPFGLLPPLLPGKQVVMVEGDKQGVTIPPDAIDTHQQHTTTAVKFDANGNASANVDVKLTGLYAVAARAQLRNVPKDQFAKLVPNALRTAGLTGGGTIDAPDANTLADTYRYHVSLNVEHLIPYPGSGAFVIAPLFGSQAPIGMVVAAALANDDGYEMACKSGTTSDDYTYTFPPGLAIVASPKDVAIDDEFMSYHATYALAANTLTVKRVVEDKTPYTVCSPETVALYKRFAKKVAEDLKSQVVFK